MKAIVKKAVAMSLAVTLMLCALLSCGMTALAAGEDTLYISGIYDYKKAYEVLDMVNTERTSNGLSALTMDTTLLAAAMQRAAEVSVLFEHTRPNGESFSSIMPSATGRGENIAAGQYSASSVMSSWMSSSGHKSNILGNYTSIGVGCFIQNGCYHWVQIFSTNSAKSSAVPENESVTVAVTTGALFNANYTMKLSSENIYIGETTNGSLTIKTGYFPITLSAKSADWRSSDESIATVDNNGVVTAKGSGTAIISSTLCGVEVSVQLEVQSQRGYKRLGGENRIETAIAISSEGWTKANNVILASGTSFADALAGVPLAYALNAPILLTGGTTLESSVVEQLKTLGAKNIYILGGTNAVAGSIQVQLTSAGYKVNRIWGASRYETAIEIAKKLSEITGGSDTVFFTCGTNYPDALSISTVAALTGSPILYAPSSGTLDESTAKYISSLDAYYAVIVGGTSAVSNDVKKQIENNRFSVERVDGKNRYETAVKVCEKYNGLFSEGVVSFATGENFPDALAGAALAAKSGAPIILTDNVSAKASAKAYLSNKEISKVYIFGGEKVVSLKIVDAHFNS